MKKTLKLFFFSMVCVMALALIASCDKDNAGESTSTSGSESTARYVDLGFPSGTLWKSVNETNPNDEYNFYTYDEAKATFGGQLPTQEQFRELLSLCTYTWDNVKKGVNFVSTINGKSIFLPAAGFRNCGSGSVEEGVGSWGYYWSSSTEIYDSRSKCYLRFFPGSSGVNGSVNACEGCCGYSVRLVLE